MNGKKALHQNAIASAVIALAVVVSFTPAYLMSGCSGRLRAPAQLSPIGDTAFYARRVIHVVAALQQVGIDGQATGAIPEADARKIVQATQVAGQAGVELAAALKAGQTDGTARDKAVAMIRAVLTDLPSQLSPHARAIVQPYIQTALTLLTVFGSL